MTQVAWQPAHGVLKILAVGLASPARLPLADVLEVHGPFSVATCPTPAAAVAVLADEAFDCVVLDAGTSDDVAAIRGANVDVPVITLGAPAELAPFGALPADAADVTALPAQPAVAAAVDG